MNVRLHILLEYDWLEEGCTVAGQECPVCHGGVSKEKTLSVSNDRGVLKWYCHRASCGAGGTTSFSGVSNSAKSKVPEVRGTVGRTYVRSAQSLPRQAKDFLYESYNITETHVARYGVGWNEEETRVVLPVYNYEGEILGANLRSISGATPKSKLHSESGAIAWYVNPTTPDVIIVEDQFSAIRASDYLTSVALLGTNLNEDRAYEIKSKVKKGSIYLALDKDAWNKAVGYAIKYRSLLGIKLLSLDKDIKNMSEQELKEWMSGAGITSC